MFSLKKYDLNESKAMSRGFTLIELLVVIAIIGILSAVVLSSLSSARSAAYDAKVKAQLTALRSAAEVYYTSNGNYGATTTTGCTSGMFTDVSSGLLNLSISVNYPVGENTIVCYSNGAAYAASDNLSATSSYWCVDSTAASKAESVKLGAASSSCL